MTLSEQILGCLLGGAIGDAVGARFEQSEPPAVFSLPENLFVTDDTQLTIATCEAITASGQVDPSAIAARFVDWYRQRRITGIGASTLKALRELEVGCHWADTGATGEYAAGNGAAMRIAPLAFCLNPDDLIERRTLRDICRMTHRNDEAYIGALAIVCTIRVARTTHKIDRQVIPHLIETLPDSRVRDRFLEIETHALTAESYVERFSASGYVVDSVPLAVLAAVECEDVMMTIEAIVRMGGDTDTIGSMCGQIVGTACGPACLPQQIIEKIDGFELIRRVAAGFSQAIDG